MAAEKLKEKLRNNKTWKYILASAVAGFIAGAGPHCYAWLDAQTARTRAEITAELIAAEKIANDEAYQEVSKVLSSHADNITVLRKELKVLADLRIQMAVMEEWKKNANRQIFQQHNRRPRTPNPDTVATRLKIEVDPPEPKPAAKAAGKRPEVKKEDPRVQQVMDQMYEAGK